MKPYYVNDDAYNDDLIVIITVEGHHVCVCVYHKFLNKNNCGPSSPKEKATTHKQSPKEESQVSTAIDTVYKRTTPPSNLALLVF